MTLLEYINDPKLANQTNRELMQSYTNKLNDIIIRENKMPEVAIYTKGDEYWFYFYIPDAKLKNVKYDVVLQFIPKNEKQITNKTISEYEVKFFSNDPGFIYYYCWCFNKENMLIDSLKFKLNELALKQEPVHTNPDHNLRMCKSFYFAYLVMHKLNLFNKENIAMMHPAKYNQMIINGKIHTDASVRHKIDTTNKINRFERKVEKKIQKLPSEIQDTVDKIVNTVNPSKPTGKSKTTRTVGQTKTTKTVGKTRKR